jgi:hypothetical protein
MWRAEASPYSHSYSQVRDLSETLLNLATGRLFGDVALDPLAEQAETELGAASS